MQVLVCHDPAPAQEKSDLETWAGQSSRRGIRLLKATQAGDVPAFTWRVLLLAPGQSEH